MWSQQNPRFCWGKTGALQKFLFGGALFLIIVVAVGSLAALSVPGVAVAETVDSDYFLTTFEATSSESFFNKETGCTYRAPISSLIYDSITRIEVTALKVESVFDVIALDDTNKWEEDREVITDPKSTKTVYKADLIAYDNPTPNRSWYFEFTAYEWCAFVFTVYHNSGGAEYASYGSETLYVYSIDDSYPEAEIQSWIYDSGKYVFDVVVRSNHRGDVRTANSPLKGFTVKRRTVTSGGQERWETIEEVNNLSTTQYNYRLVTTNSKAEYYFDIIDSVGNGIAQRVVEFRELSYDSDFESAVENYIDAIDAGRYDDFSDAVKESLKKAYYEYYLLIQDSESTDTDIQNAMQVCRDAMRRIRDLSDMKKKGAKEITVRTINSEYFGGDVVVTNHITAFTRQKYGEAAAYTIGVAYFTPNIVNRDNEMNFLKINSAEGIYTLNVGMTLDGAEVREKYDLPLGLQVPQGFDNVVAVQTVTDDEGVNHYYECEILYGNGYTIVYAPYSYGTVNLFINGKNSLLWLWSLSAIPVIAAVILTVVAVKRKKNKAVTAESDNTAGDTVKKDTTEFDTKKNK